MFAVRQFDDWKIYDGAAEGSGRSEKVWLQSDDGSIGLFKYPKLDPYNHTTYEHISEHLACQIGRVLNVKTANIDLGMRENRIGSMSYLINKPDEELIQGGDLIIGKHPSFDLNNIQDMETQKYYCLEHLLEISSNKIYIGFIVKMILFDFIIGNSDRHQNNWAILAKFKDERNRTMYLKPCPLYDNGSSLCCYVPENDIEQYLGKDKMKMNSLVNTKSRSMIGIDGSIKTRPMHNDVVKYVLKNFDEAPQLAEEFIKSLNEERIWEILNGYEEKYVSERRKELLFRYLTGKLELLNIFRQEV